MKRLVRWRPRRGKTAAATSLKPLCLLLQAVKLREEGIDGKMTFGIWNESFLYLIPLGLALEIQI